MGIYLVIALRNLLQAKRRTFFLGGALTMVAALLVLLLALAQGLTDNMIHYSTTLASGHVMALAARTSLTSGPDHGRSAAALDARLALLRARTPAEAAMAVAASHVLAGEHRRAGDLVREALAGAAPGGQAWLLAVDPLFAASTHQEEWAPALALLRSRAA